jgi:hypothetical protein
MKGLSHKPVLHRTGQVMICAVIFRSRLHEMSKVVCTAHYMPEGDPLPGTVQLVARWSSLRARSCATPIWLRAFAESGG